tara:strand:- start:106 stop:483 length:378 start_codon:yes stop_codon:yes gene_type:complete
MNRLKWFKLEEFDSPDEVGSGEMMEEEFLERLDLARDIAGFPFIVNSGFRSIAHNKALKEKGYKVAKNSSHLLGWAADLHCGSGKRRFLMIEALLDAGFIRLGIGDTFIHVDCDPEKSQMTIWTY